jgi:hypothetical protein
MALDEDRNRHEEFKRLLERSNYDLEQEIADVMAELENIRNER